MHGLRLICTDRSRSTLPNLLWCLKEYNAAAAHKWHSCTCSSTDWACKRRKRYIGCSKLVIMVINQNHADMLNHHAEPWWTTTTSHLTCLEMRECTSFAQTSKSTLRNRCPACWSIDADDPGIPTLLSAMPTIRILPPQSNSCNRGARSRSARSNCSCWTSRTNCWSGMQLFYGRL